jgi:hypothetical protein
LIADTFQIRSYPLPTIQRSRHVLSQHPNWEDFSDDSEEVGPHIGVDIPPSSGSGMGLTGPAAAEDINVSVGDIEFPDIPVAGNSGPMFSEHCPAIGVDLAESNGPESSGSFESKAKSPDTAEQIQHG